MSYYKILQSLNTLRPRQNGCKFTEDTFKRIYLNEDVRIFIKIPLKFVAKGPINNIPALVQMMAWRRPGDKPLSEPMLDSPMLDSLLTYIYLSLGLNDLNLWEWVLECLHHLEIKQLPWPERCQDDCLISEIEKFHMFIPPLHFQDFTRSYKMFCMKYHINITSC